MDKTVRSQIDFVQEYIFKTGKISPLGEKVIVVLNFLYAGLHHCEDRLLKEVEWDDNYHIEYRRKEDLGLVDFDDLTRLTVLCHDLCIRVSVESKSNNYMRFRFHHRKREGKSMECCPPLEEHVKTLREAYLEDYKEFLVK